MSNCIGKFKDALKHYQKGNVVMSTRTSRTFHTRYINIVKAKPVEVIGLWMWREGWSTRTDIPSEE